MKHARHTIRPLIVLAVIAAVFFVARQALVPVSFGTFGTYTYGYHRGEAAGEQAALPVLYQGPEKCRKCHEEQYTQCSASSHKGLSCETCHGNWQAHINTNKGIVKQDASPDACLLCHRLLESRPADFPQISDFAKHVAEQEGEYQPGLECVECHDPHDV